MPNWNKDYYTSLKNRFQTINKDLDSRLSSVVDGRITPSLDDLTIGSARKMRAAVLFFDIRSFTTMTQLPDMNKLKKTLFMLDCVIPMVMNIIYDYKGYIEKNTGDGIMAIIGAEENDNNAANAALDVAAIIFYVLKNIVNPHLQSM